jgi:hypothetical protein
MKHLCHMQTVCSPQVMCVRRSLCTLPATAQLLLSESNVVLVSKKLGLPHEIYGEMYIYIYIYIHGLFPMYIIYTKGKKLHGVGGPVP